MANSEGNNDGWGRLTQGAPLAVLLAAALYILYQLLPVLKLIAIAMLIAVIFRTLLRWLEQVVRVRSIAVLLLCGLILGFAIFVATVLVPGVVTEVQTLLVVIPGYLNSLITLSAHLHQSMAFVPDLSGGLIQVKDLAAQVLSSSSLMLRQAFSITIEVVATLILALYLAYDPRSLIAALLRLVPRRQHHRIHRILRATEIRLRGWIFGTGIAMLFLGVSTTLGLWALGIPLALPFGVIAGLFEVIPYFGSIFGTFLPALVALTISPVKFVLVVVLFVVLNQIDAYLVQPLVMGQQVNLHPVLVIIMFLIMGKLLGFIGILLAVPTVAVIVTLIDEFTEQEAVRVETPLSQPSKRS